MPALLTPPPDHLVTVGRALHGERRADRLEGPLPAIPLLAPSRQDADRNDDSEAGRRERESRWVCEWWPPE